MIYNERRISQLFNLYSIPNRRCRPCKVLYDGNVMSKEYLSVEMAKILILREYKLTLSPHDEMKFIPKVDNKSHIKKKKKKKEEHVKCKDVDLTGILR